MNYLHKNLSYIYSNNMTYVFFLYSYLEVFIHSIDSYFSVQLDTEMKAKRKKRF